MNIKHNKSLLFALLMSFPVFGQQIAGSFEEYTKKYDNDLVCLDKTIEVDIEIDKGDIKIERRLSRDDFYLNEYAGNYKEVSLEYDELFTNIKDVDAYTLKPEARGFKKIKLDKDAIKNRKIMSNEVFYDGRKALEFVYPALQKGAISHLEYTRELKEPRFFGRIFFADLHPIENQKLLLSVEDGIEIILTYFNCEEADFEFKKYKKGKRTIYEWAKKDIEAMHFVEQGPGYIDLAPHIIVRVAQFETRKGETVSMLRDVGDLFSWYTTFVEDVKNAESETMRPVVDSIVKASNNEKETVAGVYKWVQENISYIAIENGLGGFVPRSPETVCTRRYGDCKDMASLLVHMLKMADVDAHYTWIGTREIPYEYQEVPMAFADNHMIAAWKNGEDYVFLDPTSAELPFGYPSSFIQDKTALVYLDEQNFETVRVPVTPSSENKQVNEIDFTIKDGKLEGSIKSTGHAYISSAIRSMNKSIPPTKKEEAWEHWFQMGNNGFSVVPNSVKITEGEVSVAECRFELPNYAVKVGDEIYLNMMLDRKWNGKIIPDDRKLAYEYNFHYKIQNLYTFQIPEGYELSFLPEGGKREHPKFSFSVKYEKLEGNKVSAAYTIDAKSLSLKAEYFDEWNDFSRELKSITNQSIILKKS